MNINQSKTYTPGVSSVCTVAVVRPWRTARCFSKIIVFCNFLSRTYNKEAMMIEMFVR